uniref:Globin domain-containing protein n=1 Tax=Leptobrachium leishanense TaxID=445787 RepID=A0A8C5N2S6_9ANUR
MVLSKEEKALVESQWQKIAPQAETLGAEVLERALLAYPEIRPFFSKFDLTPNSEDLRSHGGKLLKSLGDSIKNYDKLKQSMKDLTELHTKKHPVDYKHYAPISVCIQVVLALHYPDDFNPKMQNAWNKLIAEVSDVLAGR